MHATQVDVGALSPETDQALNTGKVNFDANLIPSSEIKAAEVAEASEPAQSVPVSMGTVTLGTVASVQERLVVKPPVNLHTLAMSISLTLNTGFTLIKGMKELRSIEFDRNGVPEKWNFYNPFLKADKDKHTGEGVLRKTLSSIASIAHTVFGREAIYIGDPSSTTDHFADLAESVTQRLREQFPFKPDDELFSLEMEFDGAPITRPVTFGELFSIQSWVSVSTDELECLTTHEVHFNIILNAGAVYDSTEPHSFVRKAETFLESVLRTLEIDEAVDFSCNYAFDSSTLADPSVRDTLELLVGESGYSVVSKAGVEAGIYDWIPPKASNCLFGYGCDLMFVSPEPEIEEAAE